MVGAGTVDEIDSEIQDAVQHDTRLLFCRLALRFRIAEAPVAPDLQRAKAYASHLQSGLAEWAPLYLAHGYPFLCG